MASQANPPGADGQRMRKRLIVLCDGTWEDSTSDNEQQYPSNVTRLSRAISPFGTMTHEGSNTVEPVEQIIYYVKGVGTGTFDRIIGGASGIGVSANVRAAYGFLAHNYRPGDSIYFFGFSRGAYTARAIAGLVTACGLLTKKGMDSFQILYNRYYKEYSGGNGKETPAEVELVDTLRANGLLIPEARDAVEIVGVFDTVAFHQTWISKLGLARLLGISQENIEFHNTEISPRVSYAFHALALDETRRAYLPTLWHMPTNTAPGTMRLKELTQVWFSGNHTDIGGGKFDHRLSDVSLAWMIGKCRETGALAFDNSYFIDSPDEANGAAAKKPWSVSQGATKDDKSIFWAIVDGVTRNAPLISVSRSPLAEKDTFEVIHCSIADRKFGANKGPDGATAWACRSLAGKCLENGALRHWEVTKGASLLEVAAMDDELYFKDRMRPAANACVKGK